MAGEPLLCPSCAATYPLEERFCTKCGMPLVYSGAKISHAPITERHERARKIKPQYTEGPLVAVASARNQPEAEFIAGMLLEEGVPSMIRRAGGFDLPDYMAGGPREIVVPASGAQTAREVLLEAEIVDGVAPQSVTPRATRLLAALLLGITLVAVVIFLASHYSA